MQFIDGFVAAVPTENKEKYIQHATMAAPRMTSEANPMPFDGKRLIWGGFQTIVEL
nr:DUF1428 family protein [Rhodoferax sp.]